MWVRLFGNAVRGRLLGGYPVMLFENMQALSEAEANEPALAQVPFIEAAGQYGLMRIEGHDVCVFKTETGETYIPDWRFSEIRLNDAAEPLSKTFHIGGAVRPETLAGYSLIDVRMTSDSSGGLMGISRPNQMSVMRLTTPRGGKLIVEQVMLAYYTPYRPGSNWNLSEAKVDAENLDLIPMWRFSGHTEFGDVFAILADARE
jgi:hypothetical protein